ncbi:MAG: PAS domain S-box protein, partial [Leptothrix sp. (in: b-proteobacteria)]
MPPAPVQTSTTPTGAAPRSSRRAATLRRALTDPLDVARSGVSLDRLVRRCALTVLGLGLLVLAGWALQIEVFKRPLPGLTSMNPDTALGFVLAGLALAQRQHRGLRLGCAATLCLLGGLSLTQDLADTAFDIDIDQWLLHGAPGAAQTRHPGHMSVITAINFMLCGAALLLLGSHRAALRRTLETLALLAGAAALLALIGYAYGAETLYRLPGFGSLAVHTALAFMLLALGILGARADGLAGIFASADLGGQVARRFLPLALLTPLLLGGLAQLGEQAGLVNSTQKTAAYAATMVLVLAVLTWRNALLLQHSDAERQQTEAQLREREALLATLTGRARVGMVMVTAERRYAFANSAYAEVLGLPITDIVGRRVPDVLAPVYESQVRPRLDRAFAGESVSYDLRLPPLAEGAGERHFAVTYDPPVETAHGPCVIVLVVDITERTRAEAELRESENKFSIMFSQAAVPTVLSRPPEHVIVDANDAWLRLFGYSKAEIIGRTSLELGINRNAALRSQVFEIVRQNGRINALEQTLFAKSGTELQLLTNVQVITIGGQVHAVTSMQDITERKQRERNLAFLADLQKLFAPLTSSTEIMHTAAAAIARHFDLMHCLLMEIDPAAEHATLLHDHHAADVPGLSGVYRIADFQTDAERREMEAGRTVVIDDVRLGDRTAERIEQFEALGIGALVHAPYLAQGRWKFLLSVLRARPHAWSVEDAQLLTELAARLYVRLERARAEEQLRASEERMRLAAAAAQFGMYDRDLRGTEFHASAQLK